MANKTKNSEKTPLFMYLKPAKENRLVEQSEWHAAGKFSGLNRVYRNNMNEAMKTNLLFTLFMLPFLVLTVWALGYMLNLSDAQYFVGGLGMDYHPGLESELELALVGRLNVHTFYFALLIPAFTIMGLGLAGAMNVARKMLYEEEYKVSKTFFNGIKKYWWKMMIVSTLMGVVVFAVAECFIEFYKLSIFGAVSAGWYVLLVVAMILGILLTMYLLQLPPQIVTYDTMKFRHMFRNSFILSIETVLWTFLFLVFILAPILLNVYVPFLQIIIYVIIFMFGAMYYIMINLQIGNYAFDLYLNPMYAALGEDTGVKLVKKVEKVETEEPKKDQKAKKKKPAPQPYVNPKKKKSQKNK